LGAGREGDDSGRTTFPVGLEADDASAEPSAVVLAPFGDEEAASVRAGEALTRVEGESVGRGVRLEVGGRGRNAGAVAGEAKGARICPAARPAVAGAPLDEDERVRRLRIASSAELVLTVDRRVEATG